ncbi:MAG: Sec-independent protein translocase subunit TatA [Gammaproteobacteria bacterium]|nr:Sec-independent protein translocase subunit TatA [Gammaproteobacteria bacterium]NNJ71941.1 Sec-independent protein translocase subunit TatA [Enterobacterales bacterium]
MGFSIWQLLIIVLIIVLLFGTKKLKNLGSDLGGAMKGFKSAMGDEDKKAENQDNDQGRIIEGEVDAEAPETTTEQDKDKTS